MGSRQHTIPNFYLKKFLNPGIVYRMISTFKEMTNRLNKMAEEMTKAYKKAEAEGKDLSIFKAPSFYDSPRYSSDEWNRWAEGLAQKEGRLASMASFYRLIKDIAGYIQRMSFHILEAPGGLFFTTTDRPLVLFSLMSGSPLGAGWGNKDVLAVLPLDPKHLLLMCYRGKPAVYHTVLSVEDVHFWNIELMKYAVNEVYSKYTYGIALDWMLRKGIWKTKRAG